MVMTCMTLKTSGSVQGFSAHYFGWSWGRPRVFSPAPEPTLVCKHKHIDQGIISLTSY